MVQKQSTEKASEELGCHSFVTGVGNPDQINAFHNGRGLETYSRSLPSCRPATKGMSWVGRGRVGPRGAQPYRTLSMTGCGEERWGAERASEWTSGWWCHQERQGILGSIPEVDSCCPSAWGTHRWRYVGAGGSLGRDTPVERQMLRPWVRLSEKCTERNRRKERSLQSTSI